MKTENIQRLKKRTLIISILVICFFQLQSVFNQVLSQPLPNLICTSLSYSPSEVYQDGAITLTGSVKNAGTASTGSNFWINFYLSQSPDQPNYYLRLHSFEMAALAAGATRNFTETGKVPLETEPGYYYVWISIDPLDDIIESNEDDNVTHTSSQVRVYATPYPYIMVTSPNGDEIWDTGSTHNITWKSNRTSGYVNIEYSTTGGYNWKTIISDTHDNGSYSWTIPNTPSTNCIVRVSDVDGSLSDQSNSPFTIRGGGITVTVPNGGEIWEENKSYELRWTSQNTSGNVAIFYSVNAGATWNTIYSSTQNDGSASWITPSVSSNLTQCRIKVQDVNNSSLWDMSDNNFTIGLGSLIVTSPNGREVWDVESAQNITWTHSAIYGNVKLEYSTNGGSNWMLIASSTPNDGLHPWTIPNTPSTNCLVRIADVDGVPADQSDAPFEIRMIPPSQHFIPIWTGNPFQPMTIYCARAELNNQSLVAGDEIGVFDGIRCVGAKVLSQSPSSSNPVEIICSKDDGSGNGFIEGNAIAFKVWDKSAVSEHSAVPRFLDPQTGAPIGPVPFTGLGTALVELTAGGVTQSIPLYSGWNIFSFAVMPEGNHDMLAILTPILNNLVKVIDEKGHSIVKLLGTWKNSIGEWRETEGYYINVNQDVTLTVKGTELRIPLAIPLNLGWNIISYPYLTRSQDALSVVQPLINSGYLVKVTDEKGNSIIKILGNWKNSIGNMQPGEGYYVNVNNNCTLTMTAANAGVLANEPNRSPLVEPKHFRLDDAGNPFEPMNIFVVEANVAGEPLAIGDEIAVYHGDQCVGARVITTPLGLASPLELIAGKDDGSGKGFTEGDAMSFKVWRTGSGEELLVEGGSVQFLDATTARVVLPGAFEGLGTAVLAINVTTTSVGGEAEVPQVFSLYQNYPNPFNPTTAIGYDLPEVTEVRLEVYDLQGNMVRQLYVGRQDAGHHIVEWDGTNSHGHRVVSGIYFYKLRCEKFITVKKMILTK